MAPPPMDPSKPPRCPDCALLRAADGILSAAQPPLAHEETGFPRSDLEQQVLEALHALAPLPVTTLQIACLVDRGAYRQVRTVLQALAMLGTIAHPRRGYYRYRPAR